MYKFIIGINKNHSTTRVCPIKSGQTPCGWAVWIVYLPASTIFRPLLIFKVLPLHHLKATLDFVDINEVSLVHVGSCICIILFSSSYTSSTNRPKHPGTYLQPCPNNLPPQPLKHVPNTSPKAPQSIPETQTNHYASRGVVVYLWILIFWKQLMSSVWDDMIAAWFISRQTLVLKDSAVKDNIGNQPYYSQSIQKTD